MNGFADLFKIKHYHLSNDLICRFFFILTSNEALFDPYSTLESILPVVDIFNQLSKDLDIK